MKRGILRIVGKIGLWEEKLGGEKLDRFGSHVDRIQR